MRRKRKGQSSFWILQKQKVKGLLSSLERELEKEIEKSLQSVQQDFSPRILTCRPLRPPTPPPLPLLPSSWSGADADFARPSSSCCALERSSAAPVLFLLLPRLLSGAFLSFSSLLPSDVLLPIPLSA